MSMESKPRSEQHDGSAPQVLSARSAGRGPTFVLLHPGGTDSRALDPLVTELQNDYTLQLPDQRGHGRTADVRGPITFNDMAADTVAFIERVSDTPVHLFGYSDGAIVALHVALTRPDLVRSLVFVSGVFHHTGWLPGVLDGQAPDFLRDSYGEVSPDGIDHWAVITQKLHDLHTNAPALSTDDLRTLTLPVLLLFGDDDEVRFEHVAAMYGALPDGELAIVPRATHGVVVEKTALVARVIRDFHATEKSDGFAPIRRA